MDNDAGLTAREWLAQSPTDEERDAELIRLRERLAFYQSFDGLIQDNITRSGDLLRQAMQMRESAAAEIAAAKAETEQHRADDRERYRLVFSGLLDDVTNVQMQAERLARRIGSAIDQLEIEGSAGSYNALPTDLDRSNHSFLDALASEELDEPFIDESAEAVHEEPELLATDDAIADLIDPDPTDDDDMSPIFNPSPPDLLELTDNVARDEVVSITTAESAVDVELPSTEELDAAIDETIAESDAPVVPLATASVEKTLSEAEVDIPSDIHPFAAEDIVQERSFRSGNDLSSQPSTDMAAIFPELSPTTRIVESAKSANATIVLVHGVPRATTALSLKRYLEGLAHVRTVEPREFAEGILRLEVSGNRPLAFEDLRSWPEAVRLEPVHLRDDLVEVRLA